jgi:hypothetical protein
MYKVGGDPGDYQFFNEPPKEVPHGYACTYIPDSSNPVGGWGNFWDGC